MPLVKMSLIKGRSKAEKAALLEAIHSALRTSFKIPENDRNLRIFEFEPENFGLPEEKTKDYILIEMDVFPGRSLDAKRALYQSIIEKYLKGVWMLILLKGQEKKPNCSLIY